MRHQHPATARHEPESLGIELFELVRSLDLPAGDYAVFGSGPLIVRGIIEATNDLDLITHGGAWDRVRQLGEVTTFSDGNPRVDLFEGRITFGNTWKYGSFDLDELIDTAEWIEGLPFVRMEHVVTYKRAANRPKDREHLERLGRLIDGEVSYLPGSLRVVVEGGNRQPLTRRVPRTPTHVSALLQVTRAGLADRDES